MIRTGCYILNDAGQPVREENLMTWALWFEAHFYQLAVAQDDVAPGVRVSTRFMGIYVATKDEQPQLWETMIFGGAHHLYQKRYGSRAEAIAGHAKALQLARSEYQ